MTRHSWTIVGAYSAPEYVERMPERVDVPLRAPDPAPPRPFGPPEGGGWYYQCTRCRTCAAGEDGKVRAEACDLALVRLTMDA